MVVAFARTARETPPTLGGGITRGTKIIADQVKLVFQNSVLFSTHTQYINLPVLMLAPILYAVYT